MFCILPGFMFYQLLLLFLEDTVFLLWSEKQPWEEEEEVGLMFYVEQVKLFKNESNENIVFPNSEAPKTAVAAPSSGDAIPSVESPEFEKFIENESNLMKWVDSVSK